VSFNTPCPITTNATTTTISDMYGTGFGFGFLNDANAEAEESTGIFRHLHVSGSEVPLPRLYFDDTGALALGQSLAGSQDQDQGQGKGLRELDAHLALLQSKIARLAHLQTRFGPRDK